MTARFQRPVRGGHHRGRLWDMMQNTDRYHNILSRIGRKVFAATVQVSDTICVAARVLPQNTHSNRRFKRGDVLDATGEKHSNYATCATSDFRNSLTLKGTEIEQRSENVCEQLCRTIMTLVARV